MMIPLSILAFIIFFNLIHMWNQLRLKIGKKVGKALRKELISHAKDTLDLHEEFTDVERLEMQNFKKWYSFTGSCVGAAPLIGLLGTVLGMILLFSTMGQSTSVDMAQQLADGISKALFPPAMGITISLFGLLGLNFIKGKLMKYDYFFARMERKATRKMLKKKTNLTTYTSESTINP